jgi:hypothetical protein
MIIFFDHLNFIASCSRPGSLLGAAAPSRQLVRCNFASIVDRCCAARQSPGLRKHPIELPNAIAARSQRASTLRQFT